MKQMTKSPSSLPLILLQSLNKVSIKHNWLGSSWKMSQMLRCQKMFGYQVHSQLLKNRQAGGVENRVRRISFGTHDGRQLHGPEFPLSWRSEYRLYVQVVA